jgi:hypothetical protein
MHTQDFGLRAPIHCDTLLIESISVHTPRDVSTIARIPAVGQRSSWPKPSKPVVSIAIIFASRVQVYGANGRHLRCIHRAEAERQYKHRRFLPDQFNSRGEVKAVVVSSPVLHASEEHRQRVFTLRDMLGTKYSYREHLVTGNVCYDLRRLGGGHGTDYAPAHLSQIFLQVCIDAGLAIKQSSDPTCGAHNCQ